VFGKGWLKNCLKGGSLSFTPPLGRQLLVNGQFYIRKTLMGIHNLVICTLERFLFTCTNINEDFIIPKDLQVLNLNNNSRKTNGENWQRTERK
jgi:hypothetical protein